MRCLRAGDLIPRGSYAFHSRFEKALNFSNGRFLVSLVTPELGAGPLWVQVDELDRLPAQCLVVEAGAIRLDGRCLGYHPSATYRSTWSREAPPFQGLGPLLALLRERILGSPSRGLLAGLLAPDVLRNEGQRSAFERTCAERALEGAKQLLSGNPLEGARLLRGCGPGLTPSGDDFLAGHLHGLHLLMRIHGHALRPRIRAVHRAALGGNLFSNTGLHLARLGRPFERLKDLMEALLAGRREALVRAADSVCALGASSGTDLAAGLYVTLERGVAPWP